MDKKQLKRNEIIEKTIYIIYRQGYHGTGIQELADAAGIPKGSFYNYFKSKEEYAVQALHFYHQYLKDHLLVVLKDPSMPPKKRVKAFFPEIFRYWKVFNTRWDALWEIFQKKWEISVTGWRKRRMRFCCLL